MADSKKLAFAIIEHLKQEIAGQKVSSEAAESLEVAIQCLSESYQIDVNDEEQKHQYSVYPVQLLDVFTSYNFPVKEERKAAATPEELRATAEGFKATGNSLLTKGDIQGAIEQYTQAINVSPHPVYYANRAAAYSKLNEHQKAVDDCQEAVKLDPGYSKAYSRMGLAHFSLGQYEQSLSSYKKALEIEPNNQAYIDNVAAAEQKVGPKARSESPQPAAAPSAGPAAGLGGMPGGLPNLGGLDLGSLLNNPALMGMAQQFMQSPQFSQMMGNPAFGQMAQQMAQNMRGGAGAPGAQGPPQ
eukprot:Colp12_sorted_trinity150504_noHs@19569